MTPPGYKQTEVGVIPEEWECAQIASVAKLESGHTPSKRKPAYWGGKIPWVSLHDTGGLSGREILTTEQMITEEGLAHSSARMLPKGTVVFSRTATVGKTTVLGRDMATSQDFANYICGPRLDNYFLLYLFRGMGRTWKSLMAGSIHNTIYMPVFKALRIVLPPLPEQRAIATALSDVDGLLGALDRLIAKKRDLKQAAMQQLLTGQTRLPGFKGEWVVKTLGEAFTISAGKSKSTFIVESGDYWICDMGSVSTEGRLIVSKQTNFCGDFLNAGDLIMPKDDIGGGKIIGKVAYIDADDTYVLGDHVYCLRALTGDSRYLAYTINSHRINGELKKKVIGSAQLGLGRRSVTDQEIPFPPLPEQTAIASVLSEMDAELATLEQRREKTRALKQGMMQELLTGRTRLV